MYRPCVGGQRLRQGRHVAPLISLQVVGLHAGEVARLIPTADHVQVLLQAAGEEAGSPEGGGGGGCQPDNIIKTAVTRFIVGFCSFFAEGGNY